ncbi:hypothetical protein [Teredinibacter turnerae]|uniref:hypothetical protein n=1 Tax=Teredinibacter turnerae TaxID=2426 RepID=UPI0013C51049|nr:hypothetical protein [Teredinibacter turnerae]
MAGSLAGWCRVYTLAEFGAGVLGALITATPRVCAVVVHLWEILPGHQKLLLFAGYTAPGWPDDKAGEP